MSDHAGMRHVHDGRTMPIVEHMERFAGVDLALNRRDRKALQVLRAAAMAAHSFGELQPQIQRMYDVLVRDGKPITLRELLDKAIDKCRV